MSYTTPPRAARRPSAFAHVIAIDEALNGGLGGGGVAPAVAVPLAGLAQPAFVLTAERLLTAAECSAVIAGAEALGFEAAKLNIGGGMQIDAPHIRKSLRVMVDSPPFAAALWARIRHLVPQEWGAGLRAVGLNERLRILLYADAGDAFAAHRDGHYESADGSVSQLTVLLYLNQGYEGAFTTFYDSESAAHAAEVASVEQGAGARGTRGGAAHAPCGYVVIPQTGMVAIQDQEVVHGVPALRSGRKYVLRTEVMYSNTGAVGGAVDGVGAVAASTK